MQGCLSSRAPRAPARAGPLREVCAPRAPLISTLVKSRRHVDQRAWKVAFLNESPSVVEAPAPERRHLALAVAMVLQASCAMDAAAEQGIPVPAADVSVSTVSPATVMAFTHVTPTYAPPSAPSLTAPVPESYRAAQQQQQQQPQQPQQQQQQQQHRVALLRPQPVLLTLISTRSPLWLQLGALVLLNVLGFQAAVALLKRATDRAEPVTLVRLQLGLVHALHGPSIHSIDQLRSRLATLSSMIQAGQQGMWLILEEAVLELSRHQRSAALADVSVVHMQSKQEAYSLFENVSRGELLKAKAEEVLAHREGQGACASVWEEVAAEREGPGGLLSWLTSRAGLGSVADAEADGCDDALVVTLVVAARGHLDLPSSVDTWADLCKSMKAVCGLSSDKVMAVDLTWAPSSDGSWLTREELSTEYANLRPIKP